MLPHVKGQKRTTVGGLLVVWIPKGQNGNVLCILWRAFWGWACWEEGDLHSESDGHSLTWFMELSLLYDAISNAFWEVHLMSLFKLSKACSNYADLGQILLFLLSFPVMELVHREIRDPWASRLVREEIGEFCCWQGKIIEVQSILKYMGYQFSFHCLQYSC